MTEQQLTNVTGVPGEGVDLDGSAPAFTQADVDELRERVEAAEQRADEATRAAAEATGKAPRYAVYDKTFLRYLGDTHETRTAAEKAAKAVKGLRYRIDEV